MYFIEENQGLAWFENQRRIGQGNVLDDFIGSVAVFEDVLELPINGEIDIDKVLIMLLSEIKDRIGFSDLSDSSDDQRHPLGIVFPFLKIGICFSL